jgi:hypothetical protein
VRALPGDWSDTDVQLSVAQTCCVFLGAPLVGLAILIWMLFVALRSVGHR